VAAAAYPFRDEDLSYLDSDIPFERFAELASAIAHLPLFEKRARRLYVRAY